MNILLPTTITQKGQVTIPLHIRTQMGLKTGDKVIFKEEDSKIIIQKSTSITDMLAGIFHTPNQKSFSNAELEQAIEESVLQASIERNIPNKQQTNHDIHA